MSLSIKMQSQFIIRMMFADFGLQVSEVSNRRFIRFFLRHRQVALQPLLLNRRAPLDRFAERCKAVALNPQETTLLDIDLQPRQLLSQHVFGSLIKIGPHQAQLNSYRQLAI